MKQLTVDIAVIGGGPAGLAAALEAKKLGAENVLIIERDQEAGGILQQCIHDGFGIHRFKSRLAGSEYAQKFIDMLKGSGITLLTDTMVLEITDQKLVYACNSKDGMLAIAAHAVILAMGCRERTAAQVQIYGTRPAGVLTAGTVQRYINMEGYLPGKDVVILGSGDIGLIMARRMTLEGMHVQAVYEVLPRPSGLTRNIVQCLEDYEIPLYLNTTVTQIHGKDKIEAVTTAQVDEAMKPIAGTEQIVPCDLLVLAVGLIPENELSRAAGIDIDPRTKGPKLDSMGMTSVPGIFAAGNVAVVFDLVDFVSKSGENAAQGAMAYLRGEHSTQDGKPNALVEENLKKEKGCDALQPRAKNEYICIVCPQSCLLRVDTAADGTLTVSGNTCKRGHAYGIAEHTCPTRLLTSTVRVTGGTLPRLPVVTNGEIKKEMLSQCLEELYRVTVTAPIAMGDVVCKDICGTGIDMIASRSINTK